MDEKNLYEVKEYLQNLLDKYLSEEDRFSIIDFDEELILVLVDLLLERDETKKYDIYDKLQEKSIQLDKKIKLDHKQIIKISNKIILWKIQKKEKEQLENFEKSFEDKISNL